MPTTPSSHDVVADELRSTWPQRAWTLAGSLAILTSFLTTARLVASSVSPTADLLAVTMAAFAAYSLADLTTGVYHWLADNYGGAGTPLFGAQIVEFQEHHRLPSTITRRDPCNNLYELARAAALMLFPAGAALSAVDAPAAAHAFAAVLMACLVLSQQFHAWAHERPARLPPGVAALQRAGVLVSRAQHAAHHRQPHNSNYCIVSGMWNGVLDRYKVFEAVEKVIYRATGVQPRSWGTKV
ncbi:unnamed protein product [Urochloa humidicola]